MDKSVFLELSSVLSAGLCVGLGGLGSAIGVGYVGAKSMASMAKKKAVQPKIVRLMFISVALTGTCGLYALVVGIMLLYV